MGNSWLRNNSDPELTRNPAQTLIKLRERAKKENNGLSGWTHDVVTVKTNTKTIKIVTNHERIHKVNRKFVKRFKIEEDDEENEESEYDSGLTRANTLSF